MSAEPETKPVECCEDWRQGIEELSGMATMLYVHGGRYQGKQFRFCPWCGKPLPESDHCGTLIETKP